MLRNVSVWVALLGLAGCSILTVHGPGTARRTGTTPVPCTMASAAPTVDLVLGIAAGLAVGTLEWALASIPGEAIGGSASDPPPSRGTAIMFGILTGGVVAAPGLINGLVGLKRIGDCKDANRVDAQP